MHSQTKLSLKHRTRSQTTRKSHVQAVKKDLENESTIKEIVSESCGYDEEHYSPPCKDLKREDQQHVLHRQYAVARKSLHAEPNTLLCREKELESISSFLSCATAARSGTSMYISGPPGTGKTACLTHILKMQKIKKSAFVNCMTVASGPAIYNKIISELFPSKGKCSAQEAVKLLEKMFTSSKEMILVVLDEIDHLDSKTQEVLYSIFEWPHLPNSRLVLIGIANSLDLTERLLPRLKANVQYQPELLHFKAYSKLQIVEILQQHIHQSPRVIDPQAIQFCAAKVSSLSGDMRKALDICRRAVDLAAASTQPVLAARNSGLGSPGPKPNTLSNNVMQVGPVGVAQIAHVLSEVYGSGLVKAASGNRLPIQQKILVCTLLLMCKKLKKRVHTIAKFHEVFLALAHKYGGTLEVHEFFNMCQLAESNGLITLKKAKETISYQVSLRVDEQEAEQVLQDKTLLSSILSGDLPSR